MGSPRRPGAQARLGWTERWQMVLAVVPIGLALAYAGLRLAYSTFYDALGVSPEEVGLDQIELLARSLGLVVVAAIVFVVLVGLLVVPIVVLSGASLGVVVSNWMVDNLPGWALLPLGLLPLALLLFSHGQGWVGLVCVLALLFYAGAVVEYARVSTSAKRSPLRAVADIYGPPLRRFGGPVLAVAAALSLGGVLTLIPILASAQGGLVKSGWAVGDWTTPWRTELATISWIGPEPAPDPLTGHCLMYLGQANAILVLYDVSAQHSLRVPASQVILAVDPSAGRCQSRA